MTVFFLLLLIFLLLFIVFSLLLSLVISIIGKNSVKHRGVIVAYSKQQRVLVLHSGARILIRLDKDCQHRQQHHPRTESITHDLFGGQVQVGTLIDSRLEISRLRGEAWWSPAHHAPAAHQFQAERLTCSYLTAARSAHRSP